MKIRNDFVSNSSSSSFVFVVKDYNDILVADYTVGFNSLIEYRTQKWLDDTYANPCKFVDDKTFLDNWWLNKDYYDNSYYEITNSALLMLPNSLYDKLIELGCAKYDEDVYWEGKNSDKDKVIALLAAFIANQSNWCLCQFEASDHEGETVIAEEDGWAHVPTNAVWSTSLNNH